MSDLYMCELEDNVWDDFDESGDHIVPRPGDKCRDQFAVQGDSHKKPRREVIGVTINAANAIKHSIWEKEETNLPILTKEYAMLEKGSWSQPPDGMFSSSCDNDSLKEVTSNQSDEMRMSRHCFESGNTDSGGSESCANDPILSDKCAAVDDNLYRYSLSNISQTDDDLSFLDNDREDKESSDLLYYWWPNIENFEDVDKMFRNSDSTFGLGSLGNEEELCWFSSSHATEVSEDALKSDKKFPGHDASAMRSIPEHHEVSRPNNAVIPINDSSKKCVSMGEQMNSETSDIDDPTTLSQLSFVMGSDTKSESKNGLTPKDQINFHRKQSKNQNQTEGKRKDRHLENGVSLQSHEVFSSLGIHQHKQDTGPDTLSYMQMHVPYMHLDYRHPSDICQTTSGNRSDNNGPPSPSPKESSYASNPVQSMESSHGPSLEVPVKNEKREKLHCCQDLQAPSTRKSKLVNMTTPMAFGLPSAQKQARLSENEGEAHSEVGVTKGIPTEFDSSNAQESSCMSSALDEISLEATSFRQLQQVTGQLDIRTKLCIRDSLYRLARSAEQRHNCAMIGGNGDDNDGSRALMVQETNKCAGIDDMETGTNPIDRSIAHLLFHRPPDASVMPANNAMSLKSHALIHGAVTSPPAMPETLVFKEDTVPSADKKTLMTDNK
ncbi:protein LNK1 isoform X1 [Quercus lobata]|uniref:Protein LNK1 n=2 Tax=Quercus lobata TaxID=97700 RepID=A0A7N2RD62_QUELO|nr:protein LNK1 isoform X1 [Quercus lobata]XP_030945073.1 protein LNK1 isoform X1 [Quercus lobata]